MNANVGFQDQLLRACSLPADDGLGKNHGAHPGRLHKHDLSCRIADSTLGKSVAMIDLHTLLMIIQTVDRFGRRALLMFSATGLCTCFSIVAILLSTVSTVNPGSGDRSRAAGATAMVFLFQIFLGIGYLPIPWFYPSEVTTTRIRSKGQGIASFVNWMCVFCVVQITPIAIQNIAWRTFIIFAVFCACWVPIVYCFFPETNGLELEDVDYLFEAGGITGGVLKAKGGRTVMPGHGRLMRTRHEKVEDPIDEKEMEPSTEIAEEI